MKKILLGLFATIPVLGFAQSNVYFTKEITPESLIEIFNALGVQPEGKVAVKISTGESNQSHQLNPDLIRPFVNGIDGTLVENNTIYGGNRSDHKSHRQAIKDHGYTKENGFKYEVDLLDEEGDMELPMQDTTWMANDVVGAHAANYDFMVNLAHFKGHAMGGFGGVIKNQSIGMASRKGKQLIHSNGRNVNDEEWFHFIDNQDGFLECMAGAAQAVHNYYKQPGKNIVYINVLNDLSVDCDCDGRGTAPVIGDIGIMASLDPVALDQAGLDMVFNYQPSEGEDKDALVERITSRHGTHTVDYAEKLGLGTKQYNLIDLDKK